MNIEEKTKLAHDWAMRHGITKTVKDRGDTIDRAWEYADEMEKQANARIKQKAIDDANFSRKLIDGLTKDKQNNCNHTHTTFKTENSCQCYDCGLVFDLNPSNSQELKAEIDWSQAPNGTSSWQIYNGSARWVTFERDLILAPSFGFTGTHSIKRPQ